MSENKHPSRVAGSFRDPSGFLFRKDGQLYRQVNAIYRSDYDLLLESGLYDALIERGLMIPHEEVDAALQQTDDVYRVIQPEVMPFIAYPYEWSFSQLKAAALATLRLQQMALEKGMSLKDASAYNIQFKDGRPILIDTLSFEAYSEGQPWVAYRQFCQHFLAPLALMSYADVRLNQLLRVYIDGVPLDLASRLLPFSSRLKLSIQLHIHTHARMQSRYTGQSTPASTTQRSMTRQSLVALIDNLKSGIESLKWRAGKTAWEDYYQDDSYTAAAFDHKKGVIAGWIESLQPGMVWDLGANTGVFSRLASQRGHFTVSWDFDPGAVEQNYRQVQRDKDKNLLPLIQDLTNPSPSIGWDNAERNSFGQRGPADLILALALVHHLAISNNVPLSMLAETLARKCRTLIIEFVPKDDPKVQVLLATRKDIFNDYTDAGFESAFEHYFTIKERVPVHDSRRVLYLMESHV